ncbi:STM4015 family protein [Nocardia grenadensis]|uniref:STM4015 family protein n=1 Tax=Nocardia grenadensis TaxID=931537 RepID=UPI0007A3F92F|nr:STM4015 family protein [Nocardia grenadensis]
MSEIDHVWELCGLRAFDFPYHDLQVAAQLGDVQELPAAESVAWRINLDYCVCHPQSWADIFAQFLDIVDPTQVRALIVGVWSEDCEAGPDVVIDALVAARRRLPALRGLFLGDIVPEECELSWITQGPVTELLEAFPELEEFGVRGGENLAFPAVRHVRLRELTVETCGIPVDAVRGIAASDLPALNHLDLWLGPGYDDVTDLAPIFAGIRLPNLTYLALRNSEIHDDICAALASAPVVSRLKFLSISLGVLTDDGAAALLAGQPLGHLEFLDLQYNYLSDEMRDRLQQALEPEGVNLLLYAEHDEDEDEAGEFSRYVAVGE